VSTSNYTSTVESSESISTISPAVLAIESACSASLTYSDRVAEEMNNSSSKVAAGPARPLGPKSLRRSRRPVCMSLFRSPFSLRIS
jgi:hypothetical protein